MLAVVEALEALVEGSKSLRLGRIGLRMGVYVLDVLKICANSFIIRVLGPNFMQIHKISLSMWALRPYFSKKEQEYWKRELEFLNH